MTNKKITIAFIRVISMLLEESSKAYLGAEICKRTKLQSGTVYPLLTGMVNEGWLTAEWETVSPESSKQPRKLYRLTEQGHADALDIITEQLSPKIADGGFNPVYEVG